MRENQGKKSGSFQPFRHRDSRMVRHTEERKVKSPVAKDKEN